MSTTETNIGLFDRINIARCAVERAQQHCFDETRFIGEHTTARTWSRYKCYISTTVSFVEPD